MSHHSIQNTYVQPGITQTGVYDHQPVYSPIGNAYSPVVLQTVTEGPVVYESKGWSEGLCGCFSNIPMCLFGWFFFPCLSNHLSWRLDGEGDEPCPFCCYSGGPVKNRFQAKKSFGISGESCCDSVMIAVCCPLCSEVQIATELDFQKNQRSKIHIK